MSIETLLTGTKVIPVLEVAELSQAAPLARALAAGGLKVVELTLRTDCALDAIAAMKDAAPELTIGMGTIRRLEDVDQSVEAGAAFLVTPGFTPDLLAHVAACAVPALPGAATVGEAMIATEAGFDRLKFFPAEPAGGLPYLKALAGPLPDVKFCPTGGIQVDQVADYIALPNVMCVGGSWVASKAAIAAGDWDAIESNAQRAAGFA
ncbi:MAG: bifunctional 4-hydroxy-2-oxoglutarate aldolase/2-dehydro-3-deoxy-phosphogluconate aldolase [Pseudomonadota bacterium]